MWSVKYVPKPGSARTDSRSASVAGFAERETVNSSEPLVMSRLYLRLRLGFSREPWRLARFHRDERRPDDLAFDGPAAQVDSDLPSVVDSRVGVDQRQPDADLQRRGE